MGIIRFYKAGGLKSGQLKNKFNNLIKISDTISHLETELCYYVDTNEALSEEELKVLKWILTPPLEPQSLRSSSVFDEKLNGCLIVEIGPR